MLLLLSHSLFLSYLFLFGKLYSQLPSFLSYRVLKCINLERPLYFLNHWQHEKSKYRVIGTANIETKIIVCSF